MVAFVADGKIAVTRMAESTKNPITNGRLLKRVANEIVGEVVGN